MGNTDAIDELLDNLQTKKVELEKEKKKRVPIALLVGIFGTLIISILCATSTLFIFLLFIPIIYCMRLFSVSWHLEDVDNEIEEIIIKQRG